MVNARNSILLGKITVLVVLLLINANSAVGKTIHVKVGGTGDGSSWANAYGSLQDALDDAEPNDSIWVEEGTYKPTSDYGLGIGERGKHFRMKNHVGIYGGFPNTGDPNWEDRDCEKYETVLNGDIGVSDYPNDNCYHVFYHPEGTDLDPNAVLDGFVITGGNADDYTHPHIDGGGMYNSSSHPVVSNCKFIGNISGDSGGGVFNDVQSHPMFLDCLFRNNITHEGGGIYNENRSHPSVIRCTFAYNWADYGGGIHNNSGISPIIISDCVFVENVAMGGGAISVDGGEPHIMNCLFKHNRANGSGGAILIESNANITNCVFSENYASEDGGGVYSSDSDLILNNCTFSGNSAGHDGGGLSSEQESSPTLTNCTFTDNSAGHDAGGVQCGTDTHAVISNCVFRYNSSINGEGGAINLDNPGVTATLTECVFIENVALQGGAIECDHCNLKAANCRFFGNSTVGDAGGAICFEAVDDDDGVEPPETPIIVNCAFVGNIARGIGRGGAIYNEFNDFNMVNCLFQGNTGIEGGAMWNEQGWSAQGIVKVYNCTFSGNTAKDKGGGISCRFENTTILDISNCILWSDTPDEIYAAGGVPVITYSDIQGGWPGLGNIDTDPLFVDPNGPDNIPGTEDDNLHLLPYSPCIDAGDPSGDYAGQTDIDGQHRVLYDNVDIGADEVFPIAGDIDMDGDVDFKDYAYFAGHWLKGK